MLGDILYNFGPALGNAVLTVMILQALYKIKLSWKEKLLFIFIGSLVQGTAMFLGVPDGDKFIAHLLTYIILTMFLFKIRSYFALLGIGIVFIIAAVGEMLAFLVIVQVFNVPMKVMQTSSITWVLVHLIIYLLMFGASVFIKHKVSFAKNIHSKQSTIDRLMILYIVTVLGVISLNFVYIGNVNNEMNQQLILYTFLMTTCLIFSIFFVFVNQKRITEREEKEELQGYIATINELTAELRRFKHNYLNILHGMGGYIENKEWEGLQTYFSEITQEAHQKVEQNKLFTLQRIRSYVISSLLSNKINRAEALGIKVKFEVFGEIDTLIIKPHELCEILGIYLDNAIEAAAEAEEKSIVIVMIEEDKEVTIIIENTFKETIAIQQIGQKGSTTKSKDRGLGLWLVNKILAPYSTILNNTLIQDQKFRQELIIPKA